MTRTVVALYDNFEDANSAVRELADHGFVRDDISLMAGDQSGEYGRYLGGSKVATSTEETTSSAASQGAGVGASIGAALGGIGGLLIGLGALVIPGIGPVIAAGPLAAALAGLAGAGAGALAGGVTGGLIGALVDAGVPEETAKYYTEGVRRGGTLLTVKTDDTMSSQAVDIMNRHNPVDINSRASQWREQGWSGVSGKADTTGGHLPNTQESDLHTFSGDRGQMDDQIEITKTQGYEQTGTVRGVVDTNLEHNEERYAVDQNIPTTGDSDRTYGTGGMTSGSGSQTGMMGNTYAGSGSTAGMHNRGMGMSDRNDQHYSEPGSTGSDLNTTGGREGEMHHTFRSDTGMTDFGVAAPRAQDAGMEGRIITDNPTLSSAHGEAGDQASAVDQSTHERHSTLGTSGTDYNSTRMVGDRDFTSGTARGSDAYTQSHEHDYGFFDTDYRNHFNNLYGSSYEYDQFQPAYRYGYDIASDPRYTGRNWDDVEPEARQYWDEREPGAWDRIKDSVLHAWNSVRNTVD